MRNIVILNSLHFSYPLPILMRVSYNTLIVKQNTSDYYKYMDNLKDDPTTYEIFKDYLADEEEDFYWSQGQINLIEMIGKENWLTSQI